MLREEEKQFADKLGNKVKTGWVRNQAERSLKVQATPNGALAEGIRRKIGGIKAPDGGTTNVLEAMGKNVMAGLSKADPFRQNECPFNKECWTSKKTDCWQSSVNYRARCCLCGASYRGTIGHSIHNRT